MASVVSKHAMRAMIAVSRAGAGCAAGATAVQPVRAARGLASTAAPRAYELPDLPYGYDALEPIISKEIMEVHHGKHHRTYVANLNAAMENYDKASGSGDVAAMIAAQGAIRFNGGGHINHSLFWENLAPKSEGGGAEPTGELAEYINAAFGDFETFKARFSAMTIAVQGSGWGWLGYNPAHDRVELATTGNQDLLQATTGLVPLMTVDVWEHAYYLQYKNVRADFVHAIWDILNFDTVAERLAAAKASATDRN